MRQLVVLVADDLTANYDAVFPPTKSHGALRMIIGTLKESGRGEARVAVTPHSVAKLKKLGYEVVVETRAGVLANFPNELYESAGASVVDRADVFEQARLFVKVDPPTLEEISDIPTGSTLISFLWPTINKEHVQLLRRRNITAIAMDCVPRILRAQKLDAMNSMANIAGYRAVIEAANEFGSSFNGQMTAAGKVPPAKVLVIGAGIAGLSAIATAKSLGAIVRAFDTRLAVKEQVAAIGADFLELNFEESGGGEGEGGHAKTISDELIEAEMALLADQVKDVDVVITTASIPGRPAPKLITREMVASMKPGGVVVDLAAAHGGNCTLTRPDEKVSAYGVAVIGYTDLPSRLPTQSSNLYANNISNLLADMTPSKDGDLKVNLDDAVVRHMTVTHQGEVLFPAPEIELAKQGQNENQNRDQNGNGGNAGVSAVVDPTGQQVSATQYWVLTAAVSVVSVALLWFLGQFAPPDFVSHFAVFVLACFVGWQLVWNVTPALHTPLMSVTNAISGIIIIGGVLQIGSPSVSASSLAAAAVLVATINLVGGFLVTHRMLVMFRKQS